MGFSKKEILEWVAISFSRGSSQPRDQTWDSYTARRFFPVWAKREAPEEGQRPQSQNWEDDSHSSYILWYCLHFKLRTNKVVWKWVKNLRERMCSFTLSEVQCWAVLMRGSWVRSSPAFLEFPVQEGQDGLGTCNGERMQWKGMCVWETVCVSVCVSV